MAYSGYVDLCMQSHIQGWAVDESSPVEVLIAVNGSALVKVSPTVRRPDLVAHGLPELAGFTYSFARPLSEDDTVSVHFPDGSHLAGSPSRSHAERLRKLTYGLDRGRMSGLEMGPLDKPLLGKDRWRVFYVDHASKADLLAKYGANVRLAQVDGYNVVETDIIWAGGPLAERIPEGRSFDFCISSHVIEHVPDAIGWLEQIASVLVPDGIINMAVPDKERTFDRHRRTTSLAQLIDDYLAKPSRPRPWQVFDHVSYVSHSGEPVNNITQAFAVAKQVAISDRYVDVHCHVFTQQSFLDAFGEITGLGILPLELVRFFPTEEGANEFIVSLRKSKKPASEISATYSL